MQISMRFPSIHSFLPFRFFKLKIQRCEASLCLWTFLLLMIVVEVPVGVPVGVQYIQYGIIIFHMTEFLLKVKLLEK